MVREGKQAHYYLSPRTDTTFLARSQGTQPDTADPKKDRYVQGEVSGQDTRR
jgi:hypothetical protein